MSLPEMGKSEVGSAGENQISNCTFLTTGHSVQGQGIVPLVLEKFCVESKPPYKSTHLFQLSFFFDKMN